jgi:hypothetical protein
LKCNVLISVEWPRLLIIQEMFWTHWNLSALGSFYGLAASDSETVDAVDVFTDSLLINNELGKYVKC